MPTPTSGAISMNDMNVQILRASGTATISMNTIRTRYGGSGAISFSDLYKSEGFTAAPADFSNKFVNLDGWDLRVWNFGSCNPNDAAGVQIAANSYIGGMNALDGTTAATMFMYSNTTVGTTGFTSGFDSNNTTRIVTANVSRTITDTTSTAGQVTFTYGWPSTGTIHCLVKF